MVTSFVALQDVSESMGPTVFIPGVTPRARTSRFAAGRLGDRAGAARRGDAEHRGRDGVRLAAVTLRGWERVGEEGVVLLLLRGGGVG